MNINELNIGKEYVFEVDSIIVRNFVHKSRFVDYQRFKSFLYIISYISNDYVILEPTYDHSWFNCLLLNHKGIVEYSIYK